MHTRRLPTAAAFAVILISCYAVCRTRQHAAAARNQKGNAVCAAASSVCHTAITLMPPSVMSLKMSFIMNGDDAHAFMPSREICLRHRSLAPVRTPAKDVPIPCPHTPLLFFQTFSTCFADAPAFTAFAIAAAAPLTRARRYHCHVTPPMSRIIFLPQPRRCAGATASTSHAVGTPF